MYEMDHSTALQRCSAHSMTASPSVWEGKDQDYRKVITLAKLDEQDSHMDAICGKLHHLPDC